MAVQFDIKRAAVFCVGHLIRCGQFICGRVGSQAVCKKLLMAGHKLCVRNIEIIIGADAMILQRIQAAAKLALDHDGMQPRCAEFSIEGSELRRAYSLVQHLPDDLLLGHSEQRRVFLGGRHLADSLEEDRQQLLLVGQRKNGRPVHLFSGQISTGDGSFGDMQELCFGGGQGHVRVPNPFSVFFDGGGDEQRGGADERAQRVADHVIHLRHAKGVAVLGVLNPHTERASNKRCEENSAPTVPLSRQGVGKRQPQREEEEDVHQHLAVNLRLYPRGGKSGEWGEDDFVIAGCAGQNCGVEDSQRSDRT